MKCPTFNCLKQNITSIAMALHNDGKKKDSRALYEYTEVPEVEMAGIEPASERIDHGNLRA
jgi:hypothetical protein